MVTDQWVEAGREVNCPDLMVTQVKEDLLIKNEIWGKTKFVILSILTRIPEHILFFCNDEGIQNEQKFNQTFSKKEQAVYLLKTEDLYLMSESKNYFGKAFYVFLQPESQKMSKF